MLRLALVAPEAREAHCGAEFPGFGLLLARDRECVLEIRFRFRRIRLRRLQRDFAGDAMDLGLAPSFLCCFRRRYRFANAAPSIIELVRVPHWPSPNMISTNGINNVAPVDRYAVIPDVIMWTASAALPVRAKSSLGAHCLRLPKQSAFFVRQSDKFIEIAFAVA